MRRGGSGYSPRQREAFGPAVHFRVTDGGLAFWIRFHEPDELARVEAGAAELGIQLASSRSYSVRDGADCGLRIGFASLSETEANGAIRALAGTLRR